MALKVNVQRKLKGFELNAAFEQEGGTLGIFGPSGSGKSMTLRCIAGIDKPDSGSIEMNGRILFDSKVNLKPQLRQVGYLFQSYALFPHMTALENIACTLHKNKRQEAAEWLERFDLRGYENRLPNQLSGGQQQRVALARAMAAKPQALLLDEPFAAMDTAMRAQLQWDFKRILADYKGQTVLVSHDKEEIYRLCDRLVMIDEGRVVAEGKTQELFKNPGTVQAARLMGVKNISRAKRIGPYDVQALDWGIPLKVNEPVPNDITAIGVSEDGFRLAGINPVMVHTSTRMEGLRGYSFQGKIAGNDVLFNLEREAETLYIPPENILLLKGELDHEQALAAADKAANSRR